MESHVFSWSRSRESESFFFKLLESESGVGVGFSKMLESEWFFKTAGVGVGSRSQFFKTGGVGVRSRSRNPKKSSDSTTLILVEVVGPKAPRRMPPNFYISLEQSYNFRELLPQRGLSYLIGETNCSSPTSNYSLAYQKSFNRTPKGKQPICSCHPSFTGRY